MRLDSLENFNKKHPSLAPLVEQLRQYIEFQRGRNVREVVPRVAAVKLGTSEADILGLLLLFEEAGYVKPRYDLICARNGAVITSAASLKYLPDEPECKFCGEAHDGEDLEIELVFEILERNQTDAAA
jgi:hypothetical protein